MAFGNPGAKMQGSGGTVLDKFSGNFQRAWVDEDCLLVAGALQVRVMKKHARGLSGVFKNSALLIVAGLVTLPVLLLLGDRVVARIATSSLQSHRGRPRFQGSEQRRR